MAILLGSPLEILSEAAKAESFETDNVLTNSIAAELKSVFADVDVCPVDMCFTQEMVNVVEDDGAYFVELSDIAKYMVSEQVKSVKEAIGNVAECNNIKASDMTVVIESEEYFKAFLEACKKDKKKEKELKGAANLIKKLKKAKIKVCKKKK